MAFKLVRSAGVVVEPSTIELESREATIGVGDVVVLNTISLGVVRAQSTTNTRNIFGVAASAVTAAGQQLKIIPIVPGQLWEADAANNSATGQFFLSQGLQTAGVLLNQTSATGGTGTGVFIIHYYTGATTDKKVVGEFIRFAGPAV